MKRLLFFALLPILLLSPSLSNGINQVLPPIDKFPTEITEYYRNHNFINSFSNRTERNLLTQYIPHKILPNQLRKDKRLEKIYELMKKQDAKVMRVDSGIMNQKILPSPYYNGSDLLEVTDVYRDNKDIMVKVLAYYLDYETNMRFILKYYEYGGNKKRILPEEKRLEITRSSSIFSQEIHKWTLVEGRWLKSEVDIGIIK